MRIHHRATRPGCFFRFVRNIAITVSGLGCIVTALGGLGIILIFARILQYGMEGFAISWKDFSEITILTIFKPAIGLIILGVLILIGGLIVNWIVTTPVYRPRDEKPPADKIQE